MMPDPTDLGALTMAVGELKGQMRELIHLSNNNAQKIDGVAELVFKAQGIPQSITELQAEIDTVKTDLGGRISALEAERNRNDGAKGVFAAILQSRFAAWVAAAIGGAYIAIDKGVFK